MTDPQPNYQDSVDFLKRLHPEGPWNVVSIEPDDKGIDGITFFPGGEDKLIAWLTLNGHRNLYYTLNPIMGDIKKKPTRQDIKELGFTHVDLDPENDRPVADEQVRIQKLIAAMSPAPTIVVFSGGGYQCIWRLADPVPINGKQEAYDEAKLYNLQLELQYEADHCHNVDRILRLPGTVNHPGKKKLAKGRTAQVARVEVFNEFVYPTSAFTKCQMVQSADAGFTANSVVIDGNVQRLDNFDSLPLGNNVKRILATGTDPDEPNKYADRSEAVWYCVCEMVRNDIPDQTIYAIITDKDWGISAHVLDQSRPHDYAIRQIERAHDNAVDPHLDYLNTNYAVVQVGGNTKVLKESVEPFNRDEDRAVIDYLSFGDFKNYYGNQFIIVQNPSGKGQSEIPLGQWWVRHPKRRTYESVVFAPGRTMTNHYNMWKGFAYDARPGDCSLFLTHVRENLCKGKEEMFNFLIGWAARLMQRPDLPGEVAVVFRGKQGVGKGFFANHLGKLLGRHFLPIARAEHLTGKFNAHLQECVLLFADECFGAGDKGKEGTLKAIITEPTMISELKGIDAKPKPNYLHLIMASNDDWVVPVGDFDRRFFVLDVGDEKRKDKDYFGAIVDQMESGGYEALLHYLLAYDLKDFDLSNVPATAAHSEQRAHTMTGTQEWWFHKLEEGLILPGHTGWQDRVWCSELRDDFSDYLNRWDRGHRSNSTRLGMFLKKCLPGGDRRAQASGTHPVRQHDGTVEAVDRPTLYEMPTLADCRKHWDDTFGCATAWPEALRTIDLPEEADGNF